MIASMLSAIAAAAAVPAAFAGVPGVKIATYPVSGRDLAAIRASLDAEGPYDRNDGMHVEAITHWHFAWQWPGTADECDLSAATVRFSATVTLPRLVGAATAPPDVQASWRRYRAALEAHEANHVRYAHAHRGEVLAAIRGATCTTAEAAGQAVLQRLIEHDLAYDRETQHGASEGAVFP